MPFSSWYFLGFKWWKMDGLDFAIWICQKQYYDPAKRECLRKLVADQSDLDWTSRILKLLHLGHPNIFNKIKSGQENIWVTDLALAQSQRSGSFPKLFQADIYPDLAGITIKKVSGEDRPDFAPKDLAFDVIVTICPAAENCPSPILHRQQIPHWTPEQQKLVGRYTTGPLFTHWTRIWKTVLLLMLLNNLRTKNPDLTSVTYCTQPYYRWIEILNSYKNSQSLALI